jgi:hypothetical protein
MTNLGEVVPEEALLVPLTETAQSVPRLVMTKAKTVNAKRWTMRRKIARAETPGEAREGEREEEEAERDDGALDRTVGNRREREHSRRCALEEARAESFAEGGERERESTTGGAFGREC